MLRYRHTYRMTDRQGTGEMCVQGRWPLIKKILVQPGIEPWTPGVVDSDLNHLASWQPGGMRVRYQ